MPAAAADGMIVKRVHRDAVGCRSSFAVTHPDTPYRIAQCGEPPGLYSAHETSGFQSTNTPLGLSFHAQTCSS